MKIAHVFAVSCLLPATARACMGGFPVIPVASCSTAFIHALRDEIGKHRSDAEAMSKRILAENDLMVESVKQYPDFSRSQDVAARVKDSEILRNYESQEPTATAEQLQALKPRLTKTEWRKAVKLWAKYLHETAEAYDGYDPGQFCSAKDQGKGLALDALFSSAVVLMPVMVPKAVKDHKPKDVVEPIGGSALGVISLVADVAAFIPSELAANAEKIKTDLHIRRSARAYAEFVRLADVYRDKYASR